MLHCFNFVNFSEGSYQAWRQAGRRMRCERGAQKRSVAVLLVKGDVFTLWLKCGVASQRSEMSRAAPELRYFRKRCVNFTGRFRRNPVSMTG